MKNKNQRAYKNTKTPKQKMRKKTKIIEIK